jgi:hypothetical protein
MVATDRNGNAFEREIYREKGNKQNFSIQPIKPMQSSLIRTIGFDVQSTVKAPVDFTDLKKSSVPFSKPDLSSTDPESSKHNFKLSPAMRREREREFGIT